MIIVNIKYIGIAKKVINIYNILTSNTSIQSLDFPLVQVIRVININYFNNRLN